LNQGKMRIAKKIIINLNLHDGDETANVLFSFLKFEIITTKFHSTEFKIPRTETNQTSQKYFHNQYLPHTQNEHPNKHEIP